MADVSLSGQQMITDAQTALNNAQVAAAQALATLNQAIANTAAARSAYEQAANQVSVAIHALANMQSYVLSKGGTLPTAVAVGV